MNRNPPSPVLRIALRGSRLRRLIDHLIGAPLLLLLAGIRRRRHLPAAINSVGIVSCSAIGDTIVASAIARDIKAALPNCHVVVFVASSARGVSRLVDGFDDEVLLPITRPWAALRVMRAYRTDVLIDITAWPRMVPLVVALAPTDFTIGFHTPAQHRHYAYDVAAPHSGRRHELENFRALIAPLGIEGTLLPRACPDFLDCAALALRGSNQAILHPWASGFRKEMREWPSNRWVELAHELIADGFQLTITGGPADQEQAEMLASMINRAGQVRVLAGRATLMETAAEIAAAAVVITVNTGTMHLAAALDKRMVALHGPTDPVRWGPLSEQAVVLGPGPEAGGAYLNLGFEYPRKVTDCMTHIGVDQVVGSVRALTPAGTTEIEAVGALLAEEACVPVPLRLGDRLDRYRTFTDRSLPVTVKRMEDLLLSSGLLIFLGPLMLLIAVLVKLESAGPVLFRQERFGHRGRIFEIYKFRTMRVEAEDRHSERQTTREDARLTRFGRFLRRYSLDELPQLLNVINGDMSLIGPRPHALRTHVDGKPLEALVPSYGLRHWAKPGMTGWAQVNGWRGNLDSVEKLVQRVEHDKYYIANWSVLLDIKILVRTVVRMWNDDAAF